MVNRFNSACKPATFNVAPCHQREFYHVTRGTNVETSLLNKKEVSEVFVVHERETDIRALVDAGVSPASVRIGCLYYSLFLLIGKFLLDIYAGLGCLVTC